MRDIAFIASLRAGSSRAPLRSSPLTLAAPSRDGSVRGAQAPAEHASSSADPSHALVQVRMQFTSLASRLTSSVASISKVASFALKHANKCADDIWDCYLDEVSSATLNARVNLLFLLDSLLEKEGPRLASAKPATHSGTHTSYRELVERDLGKVVQLVVPDSREGVLNWMSTAQVRGTSRVSVHTLAMAQCADCGNPLTLTPPGAPVVEDSAAGRRRHARTGHVGAREPQGRVRTPCSGQCSSTDRADHWCTVSFGRRLHSGSSHSSPFANFSRNDILRRIEDDRERVSMFHRPQARASADRLSAPPRAAQTPQRAPLGPPRPLDPLLHHPPHRHLRLAPLGRRPRIAETLTHVPRVALRPLVAPPRLGSRRARRPRARRAGAPRAGTGARDRV